MPVSLEERLLLKRLGQDPRFSNDLFTGGLYSNRPDGMGLTDAMSPGGLRMQTGTRDYRALTDPNPTRMSQPMMGAPLQDANDLRQQAAASKYQAELEALGGLNDAAAPLWEGIPSNRDAAFKLLMERGQQPGEMGQVALHMAGNLGRDPYNRFDGPASPYSEEERAGVLAKKQGAVDDRASELAGRRQAVQDRAAVRGDARRMRMGEGPAMANNQYMKTLQALSGGGMGGPSAMGPGASPDPAMLTMMFGPQVAELYRLQAKDRNDAAQAAATLGVQQQQANAMMERLDLEKRGARVDALPVHVRNLPGYRLDAEFEGNIPDNRIPPVVHEIMQRGISDKDGIKTELARLGFRNPEQNDRVIQAVLGASMSPAITPPSGPSQFDEFSKSIDPFVPVPSGAFAPGQGFF